MDAEQEAVTIGAALRGAREAAGLSLADVADRTKVRPGILSLIEADEHDRLPALTYSLGFVKAFARTVGMDADAAAERYRRESDKTAPVPQLNDLQPLDQRRLPTARVVVPATVLVVIVVGLAWAWGMGWFDAATPPPPVVEAPAAPSTPAVAPATPAGVVSAAGAPAAAGAVPAAPQGDTVILTANEDVWMRVYDRMSGRSVFNGTLGKGQSFTVPPAEAGWLLRAGRAGELTVTVGGVAIPPLGGRAQAVKHVPLDAAALRARGGGVAAGARAVAPADAQASNMPTPVQ
ncbi:helix-turn-helix domain-containing protein [Sandaracinobacteroides saxicola]|uniref:DUF4115 domain-containing protein n=1 Tax=Sandaracinobacteroides saxicola TaxID=2759707 RepID=A0A7G5II53_9SPHN|nr:helix-turn-helix domain-containing protein [Sandaracinobacteroides saxicola]QMW23045.1 DUF4115 domain-containing protein [Sandaracinobacteroides saxicola]